MKASRIAHVLALALLPTAIARAMPVPPSAKDISGNFSPAVNDAFVLLADSSDPTYVYYVPRRGSVATFVDSSSGSPLPSFHVFARNTATGLFAGPIVPDVAFKMTSGGQAALDPLQREATLKHYRLMPALAQRVSVRFMALARERPSGGPDVWCSIDTETVTDGNGISATLDVPHCLASTGSGYDVDTNVMYGFSFTSGAPSQDVAVNGRLQHAWLPYLSSILASGGQWDIVPEVLWDLNTVGTRPAGALVNWRVLFERATALARAHDWWLSDSDVKAFFDDLLQCTSQDECGARISYPQNPIGSYGPPRPGENAANVARALQRSCENELFNRVRVRTSPTGAPVSPGDYTVFTLRANYDKLFRAAGESVVFNWNPAGEAFQVQTFVNLTCLLGDVETSQTTWNLDDPACRARLGL